MNIEVDITGVVLKTERLVLREWKESDLQDFFEYCSVEGVGEMAGWAHHENIEKSKQILDNFINEKKTFAITYNNKVIGSLGIEFYDEKKIPEYNFQKGREIGFVLSKDYWGQGFMPEAVKAVIKYLFEEVKLDFITCEHFNDNLQSKRVQEKCGFKFIKEVKIITRYGVEKDSSLNIIKKEDYLN